MGRTPDGSYAELVTVSVSNVVTVDPVLSWTDLAAVPEVYATAWCGLHGNLAIRPGQTVVVRGATSSLGQAAVNIAAEFGVTVLGTTRDPARASLLTNLGVTDVLIDDGRLAAAGRGVDAVFDLVGNRVLRDSLAMGGPRGRVCQLGFLGGFDPVADFNPIADLPSGVQLSFFASAFVLGTPDWPLSDVPMADIIAKVAAGTHRARPTRVFGFDDIVQAHKVMAAGDALGKMVVTVD